MSTRIYVADLAAYNSGILHGKWIDVDPSDDAETLQEQISEMLLDSPCPNIEIECPECEGLCEEDPDDADYCERCKGTGKVPSAEEWAIHDHEGWEGVPVGEYTSLETLCEWAEALDEHGPAYGDYVDWVGEGFASPDAFRDRYRGEWDSFEEYVEESFRECSTIPDALDTYIDWKSMAHDWECNSNFRTADAGNGKVYVFEDC